MAVFWFGWGKKLKNALSKKQADTLYLPKTFEATINEIKRLTTLKSYDTVNLYDGSGVAFDFLPNIAILPPMRFQHPYQ